MEATFKRNQKPSGALGIGRLSNIKYDEIHNAVACSRNFSLWDMKTLYENIKAKKISIDGVHASEMSYYKWVDLNNKIVNGLQSARRRKAKFDIIAIEGKLMIINLSGKDYFGYPSTIDRQGRIKITSYKKGYVSGTIEHLREATPEEIEKYEADKLRHEQWNS